ncbi:MAG: hypothetical protein ACFFD2_07815 [Promethearchaeota archaeon]
MKIKQITDKSIILTLPRKVRYLGLFLILLGVLLLISLYIINNYLIFFSYGSNLQALVLTLSLGYLLGYIFILEIPSIYYFYLIHNSITGYGHILLLILNITAYIATYSSIFSFSPILITGIYFLTHFKTITTDKSKDIFNFQERIFFFFYVKKIIPISEVKELKLEYNLGLKFSSKIGDQHKYYIKFYLFEIDPGFKDIPISVEDEEESLEFFRPQTLRKTLISKPTLIDSSFLNFNNYEMEKFNKIIKEFLRLTELSHTEEIINDKKTIVKFRK